MRMWWLCIQPSHEQKNSDHARRSPAWAAQGGSCHRWNFDVGAHSPRHWPGLPPLGPPDSPRIRGRLGVVETAGRRRRGAPRSTVL